MFERKSNSQPQKDSGFQFGGSFPLVNLTAQEKMYLNSCILEELNYYNNMVENFSAIYNRNPETLGAITEHQITLFGNLCANDMTVRGAKNSPLFESEKETLNDIPESLAIVFEIARMPVSIIKDTKKQMAMEVLKFYVGQSQSKKEKRVGSETQEYKVNLNALEKYSPNQKRHLQIRKQVCKVAFNEKENRSTLSIPYIKRPVAFVEDTDINKSNWSLVIIHQQPGIIPNNHSQWIADFKAINYGYMLKYLDKKYQR